MHTILKALWQNRWWCVGTMVSLLLLLAALVLLSSDSTSLPFIYALF
jgi:hypothetical protein